MGQEVWMKFLWIVLALCAFPGSLSGQTAPPEEIAVVRDISGEWNLDPMPRKRLGKGHVLLAGAHIVPSPAPAKSPLPFIDIFFLSGGSPSHYVCCNDVQLPPAQPTSALRKRLWQLFLNWLRDNPPDFGTAISGLSTPPVSFESVRSVRLALNSYTWTFSSASLSSLLNSPETHILVGGNGIWDLSRICSKEQSPRLGLESAFFVAEVEPAKTLTYNCSDPSPVFQTSYSPHAKYTLDPGLYTIYREAEKQSQEARQQSTQAMRRQKRLPSNDLILLTSSSGQAAELESLSYLKELDEVIRAAAGKEAAASFLVYYFKDRAAQDRKWEETIPALATGGTTNPSSVPASLPASQQPASLPASQQPASQQPASQQPASQPASDLPISPNTAKPPATDHPSPPNTSRPPAADRQK
jgi:hypothetical protein